MDYDALRKFISAEIMRITLEWNAKEEVYPVRPPNLSEAQSTVWDMLVNNKQLGSLSEVQSRALRDVAVEVLGTKIPEKYDKTLKSIPPYVLLTDVSGNFECSRVEEQVIMKMSGIWASSRGTTSKTMPIKSHWARLPTPEEVADLVSRVPEDKLCISFAGLLPIKPSKEIMDKIAGMVTASTETTFASRPVLDIPEKEAQAYKMAADVGERTSKMIFLLADKEWSDDNYEKVKRIQNETPKIEKLSAWIFEGKTLLNLSGSTNLYKGELVQSTPTSWDTVVCPDEKAIAKILKSIQYNLLFAYLPADMQEELLKEVQFE